MRREHRTLRMERDYLKTDGLLRERECVRFTFIAAEKAALPAPTAVPDADGLAGRVLRLAQTSAGDAGAGGRADGSRDRGDSRGEPALYRTRFLGQRIGDCVASCGPP
jgi:hypothetical protein